MMIVVQNNIPVKEEYREDFEKRFLESGHFVSRAPGFIRNEVLRPIKGDSYVVVTYWNSMEEFTNWTQSEEFRKAHANPPSKEMFKGENYLTIHEVFASTEKIEEQR